MSLGGVVALPMFFQPTKWAVEAMAESLAEEVRELGIKVTIIEPGSYRTEFFTPGSLREADRLEHYDAIRAELAKGMDPSAFGDPAATAPSIFAAIADPNPPLRLILGSTSLPLIEDTCEQRPAEWRQWAPISNAAQR